MAELGQQDVGAELSSLTGRPRRGGKFAQRREATRATLLRLGLERFPDRGYSSTTIEDIIRGSGHARGGFYFHFPDKEHFFLAVLEHRFSLRGPWWSDASDPANETLEDCLRAVGRQFVAADGGYGATWAVLVADFAASIRNDAELIGQLGALQEAWIGEIGKFVLRLRERGLVRDDEPVVEQARAVRAVADGYNIQFALYGTPPTEMMKIVTRVLAPES